MNLAAAIVALALAQTQTTWEADVRLGGRARSPSGNDGPNVEVAADVEVAPHLGGDVQGGGWNFGLDYLASFRARQPHLGFRPEHYHRGTLQAGWRREGRARPFLFASGSYGLVDLTNLAGPQAAPQQGANQTNPETDPTDPGASPPEVEVEPNQPQVPVDPIPRLESLLAYGIDATLGVEVPLSPRTAWTFAAGFFHGGGADPASRATLPVQNAPRASTRIDWNASRLDHLSFLADARMSWFQTLEEAGEVELLLGWRRTLAETTTLELRAGLAGLMNKAAPSADPAAPAPLRSYRLYPAGQLLWNHRFDLRSIWGLSLWATAGASPFVDRFRAIAYEQVTWQGGVGANLRDWSTLRFGGGASLAVGAEQQLGTLVTSWIDGSLSIHPQRWWRVDLTAARSVVTTDLRLADGTPIAPVVQWVIGLGLTVMGQGQL